MTSGIQLDSGLVEGRKPGAGAEDQAERAGLESRLPELHAIAGFPAGSDAAILALSRPRAYTACPNPYAADVVLADDVDRADSPPFATDISVGKGHRFYRAHAYPTKVPHEAITRFILHYTKPGDLVLDGFCGSGMTGVAAQACGAPEPAMRRAVEAELGPVAWGARRAVLQDLSPSATFIAAGVNLEFDSAAFDQASRALLSEFNRDWDWMYQTTSPTGTKASIDYTVWSEVFTCPHCASAVVFFEAAFDEKTNGVRELFACPSCGVKVTKKALHRRLVHVTTLGGDTIERVEFRPVRLGYRVGKATGLKKLDEDDHATLRRIATLQIPWVPKNRLPLDDMTEAARVKPLGFSAAHHFWTDRALAALAVLWDLSGKEPNPRVRQALRFWIEQGLWGFSFMNRYVPTHFSHVNQYLSGALYIPSLHAEPSVRYNLEGTRASTGKRSSLVALWRDSPARDENVRISTGSSSQVPLPNDSVDYIFIDPPFGRNFQYSDLAIVIESWHQVLTAATEEAVLDQKRHKGLPEYTALMTACFREFYRVLKPGRWMTVEFSNSQNAVWLAIQQALTSVGFVISDTRVIDKEQLTHRQLSAANALKRDLIISAYKPRAEVAEKVRLAAGSEDGVWTFIREHLRHLAVTEKADGHAVDVRERQLDRLFDAVVKYHVANGIAVPISLTEFRSGMEHRFNRADGMYFLANQEEEYQRWRLTLPRSTQESAFITNEATAVAWLRRLLETGRRTFTQIQPAFFKEVQSGLLEFEQMPELRDLLAENFLQGEDDRWFIPDQSNAAQMEQLHNQALLRVFSEYVAGRGSLVSVRTEAIRAGFTKAWNERDFESIHAVGRRLPADFWVVETALHHYYRAAERHASRP